MSLYPDYKSRGLNLFKYELIKRLQHISKAEAYKTKILHTMSILHSRDTPLNSGGINSASEWYTACLWLGTISPGTVPISLLNEYHHYSAELTGPGIPTDLLVDREFRARIGQDFFLLKKHENEYIRNLAITLNNLRLLEDKKGIISVYRSSLSARFKEEAFLKSRLSDLD